MRKIFFTISLVLSLIMFLILILLDILPFLYLSIVFVILFFFNLINSYLLLSKNKKRKKKRKKLGYILSTIFIVIISIITFYLGVTYNFLNFLNKDSYKTEKFLVLVLKNSNYEKLKDLDGLSIGYVSNDITSINKAIDKIKKKISIKDITYENYDLVFDDVIDKKIESALIEESNYNLILEEKEEYKDLFKIIDTITIKTKTNKSSKNVNVTKDTFNILISGIDTDGDIGAVSRSDVNMIVTVNPKTKQILLTSIPRDYYVKLHGTSGYNDKLTHAGIYGIDMSIDTISDLLDIDINYYFRVNFSTLVNVIDALDGVDVYSKYSFVSYIGSYKFYEGYNHMNGNQALGFARERKSLPQGDINRAQNQQAVIDGIIRKATSSSIIYKYSSVLNSIKDSFQTNFTNKEISSLIKMQINDNSNWNITSNVLDGTSSYNYTYSYTSQKLYVMEPSIDSINNAKELIKKVKGGITLDSSYNKKATDIKNPTNYVEQPIENNNPVKEDNKSNNDNNIKTQKEKQRNIITNNDNIENDKNTEQIDDINTNKEIDDTSSVDNNTNNDDIVPEDNIDDNINTNDNNINNDELNEENE